MLKENFIKKYPNLFGCSIFCFAMFLCLCTSTFVKKITLQYNIPTWEVIFIRQSAIVLMLLPFMIKMKFNFFNRNTILLNSVRNIIYAFSTFIFYTILQKMSLNEITGWQFFVPIIASIMAIFIMKERGSMAIWLSLIICVFGAFVIKGDFNKHTSTENIGFIYYILLIIFILMRSFCTVLNGKLASIYPTSIIVFYTHTIMLIISACFCWQFVKPNIQAIIILSFVGLIYLVEYILIYVAHKYCTVLTLQPCEFSKFLFSILLSTLILNETTTLNQVIGSLIIVLGFCIMIISKKKIEKKKSKIY